MFGKNEVCQKNRKITKELYGKVVWEMLDESLHECWMGRQMKVEEIRKLLRVAKNSRELRSKKSA